jgi:DNA topoisomerase-1
MARPLVVVESPAKAKTISKFLGSAYDVRASVGHVADLPSKGLAVDVDNGFKPTYELTDRGKQVIKDLKAALKDASELYLATDEDREGEAISWHLLEHLKPKVPVKRMVFHEITASAIDHAVNNPRGIDYGLVDAAETRRILDRLYGYEVSPVLWRRVNRGLSAGRVQSPLIRLIVERERERIAFVVAGYWGIELTTATAPSTARGSPPARTSTPPAVPRPRWSCSTSRGCAPSPTASRRPTSGSARSRRSRTAPARRRRS